MRKKKWLIVGIALAVIVGIVAFNFNDIPSLFEGGVRLGPGQGEEGWGDCDGDDIQPSRNINKNCNTGFFCVQRHGGNVWEQYYKDNYENSQDYLDQIDSYGYQEWLDEDDLYTDVCIPVPESEEPQAGGFAGGMQPSYHSADTDEDWKISMSELLRVVQLFNARGYHCQSGTEDGYAPLSGDQNCDSHDADYNTPNWKISLSEVLRVIQFYNSDGYYACAEGEDGFCVGIRPFINQDEFKIAFILVGKNNQDFTEERLDKLNFIKNHFSRDFSYATQDLASMDTSYPVVMLVDDGSLTNDYSQIIHKEVSKKFFEIHPDDFDFISIYTTFTPDGIDNSNSIPVRTSILNIGRDFEDKGYLFGSDRKLKAVTYLRNIDFRDLEDRFATNILLHEIGHTWCCYVGDNFAGDHLEELGIVQQGIHFYRGLESPFGFKTSMFSDSWISNGDGTYRRQEDSGDFVKKYHPFQLYFMGLLDDGDYDLSFNIYDAGVVGESFHPERAEFYKRVSVNEIIAVEGLREDRGDYFLANEECSNSDLLYETDEVIFDLSIVRNEGSVCITRAEVIRYDYDPSFEGKSMVCHIPKYYLADNLFLPLELDDYALDTDYCEGDLVSSYVERLGRF